MPYVYIFKYEQAVLGSKNELYSYWGHKNFHLLLIVDCYATPLPALHTSASPLGNTQELIDDVVVSQADVLQNEIPKDN